MDPALMFLACMTSGAVLLFWHIARNRPKRTSALASPPALSGAWLEALGHSYDVPSCQSSLWLWRPMKSTPIGSVLVLTETATGRTVRVGSSVKYADDEVYRDRITDHADVTVPDATFDTLVRLVSEAAKESSPFRSAVRDALVHADDSEAPLSNFRVLLVCSEHEREDAWLSIGLRSITLRSRDQLHERELEGLRLRRGAHHARVVLVIEGLREAPLCIAGPPEIPAPGDVREGPQPHFTVGSHDWRRLERLADQLSSPAAEYSCSS